MHEAFNDKTGPRGLIGGTAAEQKTPDIRALPAFDLERFKSNFRTISNYRFRIALILIDSIAVWPHSH
jgi:hypothetical protein